MKYFYSHIISIESVVVELEELNLSQKEKEHLSSLIDANMHNQILDLVLTELEEDDKNLFLDHLKANKHDEIWELLHTKSPDMDAKIKKLANDIRDDFLKDIKEAKKVK